MHLERGEYRLDQDRSLDGAPGYAELVLGRLEDVVPEPRLEVALQLRQVEVRASRCSAASRVVEEVQSEVEETTWDLFPVDEHVLLEEMPPSWPRQDYGNVFVQLRLVRLRVVEGDGTFDRLFSMLSWLSSMLCQVGQLASSKSAIQQLAPEFRALIVIFRSGGPVNSTRRS